MDAKFLTLTGLLSAGAFGAVWFVTVPTYSDASATALGSRMSVHALKPLPRYVVEAPPQDMRPNSVVEVEPDPPSGTVSASNVYYPNCKAAWAAGAAPIHRGEPGYRPEMDGDSDGIACEPHRSRY